MSEQAQDDSAAQSAAFESGFVEVRGDASAPPATQPAEKASTTATEDTSARSDAADSKVTEEVDPWEGVPSTVKTAIESMQASLATVANVPERLRKFEGNFGSLNASMQQLKTALASATTATQAAGAKAPDAAQVQQAQRDPARWKQLKEDYPDWAEALEPELADIRAQIAAIPKPQPVDTSVLEKKFDERVSQATQQAVTQARALGAIDAKHPGWEDLVKTPEFKTWRNAQTPEIQALGGSDKAGDANRMLDLYADSRKKAAEKTAQQAERKKRLDRATAPDGVTVTTTQPSVEDAFVGGFKTVRGG